MDVRELRALIAESKEKPKPGPVIWQIGDVAVWKRYGWLFRVTRVVFDPPSPWPGLFYRRSCECVKDAGKEDSFDSYWCRKATPAEVKRLGRASTSPCIICPHRLARKEKGGS